MRSNSGGNLDGDIVDIITSEKGTSSFETASCFALAENGFSEQVDVEANTGLAKLGNSSTELGIGGVHDEVAHHVAQHLARNGDNYTRKNRRNEPTHAHCSAHIPGQERWNLRSKLLQITRSNTQVFGVNHTINEAHGEGKTVGILEHTGQHDGAGVNGESLCFGQPFANQCNGILGKFR